MKCSSPILALSIRQPYVELILRGKKTMEYRSLPTRVRERIYLYASKTPGEWEDWEDLGLQPGDLPTGLLLGTVEIVNCTEDEYGFVWHLANPKRLKPPLRSDKHPNPMWWKPFEVYVSRPTRRTGT